MKKILISTEIFEKEIVNTLCEAGMDEGKEFIGFSSFTKLWKETLSKQLTLFPEIIGITKPITAGDLEIKNAVSEI